MKRENGFMAMLRKALGKAASSAGRIAMAAVALLTALCLFAVPAFAATSDSDVPACDHRYGEWDTVKAAGTFIPGERVRECSECGETQTILTLSPLMWIIVAMVAIIAISLLAQGMSKAASGIGKFLKKFFFWLIVAFILAFLLGALVFSLNNGVAFGTALANGTVDMIAAKAFFGSGVYNAVYGEIGGMIMNSLFYVTFIGIIAGIVAFIKYLIRKTRELGKKTKEKAVEVKDKIVEVIK